MVTAIMARLLCIQNSQNGGDDVISSQKYATYEQQIMYLFHLRNDLYCVEWGIKLYSLTHLVAIVIEIHSVH